MESLLCPKCGSSNIRRSRTKGLTERLLKKFGYRAHRCGERDCRWRGLLKVKSVQTELYDIATKHKHTLLVLVVGFGLIGLALWTLHYLLR